MYMRRLNVLLGIIIVIAFFLRAYQISTNPPALSWDEASIGYNAFSILTTGKDEHGRLFPMDTFAAFGDYKPPVPIYLTVPFVAVFGLSELAVRMPSVIAGTLTVLCLYYLVLELFQSSKKNVSEIIALISAGLLTVTPWHIMLSRAGFEGNIAFFFIVLGVLLFLRARNTPSLFLYVWLPFVFGMYTFNSARYAGPLIALGAFAFVWRSANRHRGKVVAGITISFVALLPLLPHLFSKEARLRFDEVNIFTNLDVIKTANARLEADGNTWWAKILDNRRINYARSYLVHFFDNIEPRFLFIKGDGNPKFSIQDTGQLLFVTAPFIFYGALKIFYDAPGVFWLLVWWLVASIAPAAVARETPHALRVENGMPFYIILAAYGMVMSFVSIKKNLFHTILLSVFCLLFVFNFLYFWHNLIRHYPVEYSGTWQYGYKQAVEYVRGIKGEYDTIVLTESIGRPYIYTVFYEKTDPNVFRTEKDASFDAAGFYNVYGWGKYRFVREDIGSYEGRTLFILPPASVPQNARVLKEIQLLNGETELVIFES